jgi:hypothetical protein
MAFLNMLNKLSEAGERSMIAPRAHEILLLGMILNVG